jgi:hypothetical protein
MSKTKGTMYYCFTHNQGCLIIGNKVPRDINDACIGCSNCQWEDIGSFTVSMNLEIHGPTQEVFKNSKEEMQNDYFKNKIYDENMRRISLS